MRASKIRIKVSCEHIIDRAITPWAVLFADIQIAGKPATRTRYVLLESEIRDALSSTRYDLRRHEDGNGYSNGYGEVHRILNPEAAFPTLIRAHAFTSSGVILDDVPLAQRTGTWSSAESLWVRADLARVVLADLYAWIDKFNPGPGSIKARNWNALVGAQALAYAADLPAPGSSGCQLDEMAKAD